MRIRLNGKETALATGSTVVDALALLGAPDSGVAVAVDGDVVPRGQWQTELREDAVVEVLTAVQGG
ncbi:sulfur carrier protein ThiS [Allokutzneria sp. A3M-2-11 16]|uniref:sulfur carrier protein ThiS n=1 Tax=Allokutzneria sp. A3M-2-11 16 TaxID=2962043 RepID=UPI0020B8566E|nr:sulfur carrier protein ThiS [Allokutzneria sp. A3M-2-11 16]MCP3800043.1 sulfur carrier protein ThiS [Allokutzneria sp. A3M-2-11 16]